MIDQDTTIARQLTLWDQRGSRVIRGNLLVIPINQSFLYVEPVFLIAEGTNIPQLKRVIVSDGDHLAMESTLARSLQVVSASERRRRKKRRRLPKRPHPGHARPCRRPTRRSGEATGPHSGVRGSN